MQVLNISVLNVPAKYFTSKPYPLHFIESIHADFGIYEAIQKQLVNVAEQSERIGATFAITGAQITSEVRYISTNINEIVEPNFAITSAQITVENKPPVYISTNINEIVEPNFAITSAQITVENKPPVYISTNINELVELNFAITGAQITN